MSTLPFDPARDHLISRETAAGLIQDFRAQAPVGAHHATAFGRSAFEQLLAQPGAAGIRVYRAQHADGAQTLVMVAVDADGRDLAAADGVFVQNGSDCPPFCTPNGWV